MSNDPRIIREAGVFAEVRAQYRMRYVDVKVLELLDDGWYRCELMDDGTIIELHGTCRIMARN